MNPKIVAAVSALIIGLGISSSSAQETEQDIVKKYLQITEEKHTSRLGWASLNFSVDRINRNNHYNDFVTHESRNFPATGFNWLDLGYSFGAEFGVVFDFGLAWSFGGEYWLKMGEELSGSYLYLPAGGQVVNPASKIHVYGASTRVQYYLLNQPTPVKMLTGLALRAGGSIGYYYVSWDLWPEYENLNLATEESLSPNITFKGSAPGFSVDVGADYPLNFWNLAMGADLGYLYLNFGNVAWYNSQNEEIIATFTSTSQGRVDLDFSGVRGKIEVKRYFGW